MKKVPYPMVAAMNPIKRHAQMAVATLHYKFPRLLPVPIHPTKALSIVGYGPSLADTWQAIQHPILSMSGATRFLADRGVIADYHVDMDPRAHKIQHLKPPIPGVHYLMASVCPLETWEVLKDEKITLWHTYSGPETYIWVRENDPNQMVIRGGSTIGLTAFHLGNVLGYRHFEVFGMDGSFSDSSRASRHAGPHFGHSQNDGITWDAGRVTYHTSRIMANAVSETLHQLRSAPIFCIFHGRGLTQALVREAGLPNACCADETRADEIRNLSLTIVDVKPFHWSQPSFDQLLSTPVDAWVSDWSALHPESEKLRARANYNTGSIGYETWILLRSISRVHAPKVTIEIGTFIGKSTRAFLSERVYTCDKDNDCLEATDRITTFPRKTSTEMLERLVANGVKADMFFFDGRIQPPDFALILRASLPHTIYVFDDHEGNSKGVVNVGYLHPLLKGYKLVTLSGLKEKVTLAALVPERLAK